LVTSNSEGTRDPKRLERTSWREHAMGREGEVRECTHRGAESCGIARAGQDCAHTSSSSASLRVIVGAPFILSKATNFPSMPTPNLKPPSLVESSSRLEGGGVAGGGGAHHYHWHPSSTSLPNAHGHKSRNPMQGGPLGCAACRHRASQQREWGTMWGRQQQVPLPE
jgi:hypothetical protein